uniref:FAD-binding FR-type domain-containing protein n=1 Tax=Gibberella zeae TaxID=5518 RepID=A0A4E9EJ96_GIBZA
MWYHIPTGTHFTRMLLYAVSGIFLSSLTWQVGETIYMNGGWFQSVFLTKNGSYDYIRIKVTLRKPVRVKPGQHINVWIPMGPLSGLQSHPFVIANWSPGVQKELKLFAGVKRGLTNKLKDAVKRGLSSNIGLYTGPYGATIDMKDYESILLVATGLGVVAVAPYLQWLVHAIQTRKIRSAPIHLIWHIPSWTQSHAVFDIIDFALALDEGYAIESRDGERSPVHKSGIKISMCYEEAYSSLHPTVQLFIKQQWWKGKKIEKQTKKGWEKEEKQEWEKELEKEWEKEKDERCESTGEQGMTRIKVYNINLPLRHLLISDTVESVGQSDSKKPTRIAASVTKAMRKTIVDFAIENPRLKNARSG